MLMKKIFYGLTLMFLLVFFLFAVFPGSEEKQTLKKPKEKLNSRLLFKDLINNSGLIIYGASNKDYSHSYFEEAEKLQKSFNRLKLKIVPDTSVTESVLQNNSAFIIGTYHSNKIIHDYGEKFPIKFYSDGIKFLDKSLNSSDYMASFVTENFYNKKKFFFIISANSDITLLNNINYDFGQDFKIKKRNEVYYSGNFYKNEKGKWIIDEEEMKQFNSSRVDVIKSEQYYYVNYNENLSKNLFELIIKTNDLQTEKIKEFFGSGLKIPKIEYHLYQSFEQKGLITENTSLSHFDEKYNSVYEVVNDWINGNDFQMSAKLILRKNFGKPEYDFIETGLATYFSENWRGKGYKYWASKIYLSENVPSLKDLFDNNEVVYESDFIVEPISAAFVEYLINEKGKNYLLKIYKNGITSPGETIKLENDFHRYLKNLSAEYKEYIERDRANFSKQLPPFQKGFCFAHEGYDIYNGYLSKLAVEALKKLKALNANSISVTPFTSMRAPYKAVPLRLWKGPGTENDESIIFVKHSANQLGLSVMLKPHIYLWNSWPGEIEMNTEKDWNKFLYYYYRWIRHYAFLAEMYGIPIFCIGNELSKSTLTHEMQWREIINRIRKIYSGKLVYGANWGSEIENINFWNDLDYIGVSEYYPLSKSENPSDKDLLNGADSILNRIEIVHKKFNKPVIFTEVGFRSSKYSWKTSLEGETRNDTSFISQLRSYKAVFNASYKKRNWLKGMYWWKWPSYLEHGGNPERALYTPNSKPAEKVVQEWYGKEWN